MAEHSEHRYRRTVRAQLLDIPVNLDVIMTSYSVSVWSLYLSGSMICVLECVMDFALWWHSHMVCLLVWHWIAMWWQRTGRIQGRSLPGGRDCLWVGVWGLRGQWGEMGGVWFRGWMGVVKDRLRPKSHLQLQWQPCCLVPQVVGTKIAKL